MTTATLYPVASGARGRACEIRPSGLLKSPLPKRAQDSSLLSLIGTLEQLTNSCLQAALEREPRRRVDHDVLAAAGDGEREHVAVK